MTGFEFDFWRYVPLMASAAPQTAFILIYALPVLGAGQWWRDFVGRALFFKSATLALLLDFVTCAIVADMVRAEEIHWNFGVAHYGIEDRFVISGYWLVFLAICYQLWALRRERRRYKGKHTTGAASA